MIAWYKIGLILAFLALYGGAVWHVKAKFDQAAQEAILEAQVAATARRQAEIETVARAAESDLLTERQKSAMLDKKLGAIRADKTHSDCRLDAATLGLLADATKPNHPAR